MIATGTMAAFSANALDATPEAAAELYGLSGEIRADGSSTVWPMTDEAALLLMERAENVDITVDVSGTGGGFRTFCAGETDLQNASRPINAEEMEACRQAGVSYYLFEVAYDGITVVVHPDNDFAFCLTVEQLRQLWQPDGHANTWRDLDPAWPDEAIELYGPGPDSGTFDFFTGAIVGEEGASRTDYVPSENDLDLVEGVATDDEGLGYFGYAYFEGARERLKPIAIDAGSGCVLPSSQTIGDGTYQPLSRPLFVYVSAASLTRAEVAEFMRFYLVHAQAIAIDTGYIASPASIYEEDRNRLEAALAGTLPPDGP
jgi:phosphate transport system substrate-binding protein